MSHGFARRIRIGVLSLIVLAFSGIVLAFAGIVLAFAGIVLAQRSHFLENF